MEPIHNLHPESADPSGVTGDFESPSPMDLSVTESQAPSSLSVASEEADLRVRELAQLRVSQRRLASQHELLTLRNVIVLSTPALTMIAVLSITSKARRYRGLRAYQLPTRLEALPRQAVWYLPLGVPNFVPAI